MDRFNLKNYRQQSRSSVPHTESQPVASTSKLPPLQNGTLSSQNAYTSQALNPSAATVQHLQSYWMLAAQDGAYTQAQAQAQAQIHHQQEIQRQQQQQRHHQDLRGLGREGYQPQNHYPRVQQDPRPSSSSGDGLAQTFPSPRLNPSSTASSTSKTSPTVAVHPNPNLPTNPGLNPSPALVLQLSELVAQKVFEAMERAGIVSAGANGSKGKERASGPSDAHIPTIAPDQPNDTHMKLLVQVIKEMKQDVKGIKDVLVGSEEGNDTRGKSRVIVLDHTDEEDNATLGSWRTRLDQKRKDRKSNRRMQTKESKGMLQRLESLEMDVQEMLERLRDPLAGVDGEGVFRRQQEGPHDQPQAQAQREPPGLPLIQQQQATIIDLTTSPSRDGTEGVGDSEMLVDKVARVDGTEKEQGLDQIVEDMEFLGDKSGAVGVGVGAVRMMQVDEEPAPQGEANDVFGPLTPNSLDASKPLQLNSKGLESSEAPPLSPRSGSEEAPKMKIRLSPKVTLVVESPPHQQGDVLTSTPLRPARSATPPPGFSPVDWSKFSDVSRSRSGSLAAGMKPKRSESTSLSSSSLLSTTKPVPEIQKFVPTCSASSTPRNSYPLRRPSEDSIAALRMEVRQSPRMSPGVIVLEGSMSVDRNSPLGMSRSVSEMSLPPAPPPPTVAAASPTKAQAEVVAAPGMMKPTVSTNPVLTPLPATMDSTVVSSPQVMPPTELMSVDSPSQPAQTFEDAEDVPSPSPALASLPQKMPPFPASVVSSVEEEQDVEKKPEVENALPSRANLSVPSRLERRHAEDLDTDEEDTPSRKSLLQRRRRSRWVRDSSEEEFGEGARGGHQQAVEAQEEEEEGEVEGGKSSIQLDKEGKIGADQESYEEEEEGVTGPSSEAEPPLILTGDRTFDEYEEDEGEEENSVERTDEDEEGVLVTEEEEELQREVEELREDEDEQETTSASAPLSPAAAANSSSPSASQSASQDGHRSSSPPNAHHSSSPVPSSPNAYSSSGVSSITINLDQVDLGNVRFGPPKKVPSNSSALQLSQSTTATADCEAVVQSLVAYSEDVDGGADDNRLAVIEEADERAAAQSSAPVVPAEADSEEEADNLGHSFEGGVPADDTDDNEHQEDSNLDHTFQNGVPADKLGEHGSESTPAVPHQSEGPKLQPAPAASARQQTKPALAQARPNLFAANPKTPQKPKTAEYIYIPSGSSSPIKKTTTSREVGNGKGKETEKVKMEKKPVTSIDVSSDDDDIVITGRSRRGRPPPTRPILTKTPVKLELFDGPGPIRTSTPVQGNAPFPPFPFSSAVGALLNSEPRRTPKTSKRPVDLLGNLSPMSALTPSPKRPMRNDMDEVDPRSPPFDPKKHAARVDDDDDTEIRPIKKKRKASAATSATGSMKLDLDRSSEATAKAPPAKKRLLVIPKAGQSAAVTRVKKRKANPDPDDDDEEPPLKKAMLRRSVRSSETSSNSNSSSRESSKEKGKEKEKPRERPVRTSSRSNLSPAKEDKPPKDVKVEHSSAKKTPIRRPRGPPKKVAVVWPTCSNPNYDQHLQCDICRDWYHIGCVGVETGDYRLDETEIYTCPPCEAFSDEEISPSKRKKSATVKSSTSKCARPDCQVDIIEPDDVFEVEAIVGMSGSGASAVYLVKWQNYGFDEVTKQTLESMELSDPRILLETFYKAAKAEGLELKTRKNEYAVLKAAAAAGWNSQGEYVIKSEP
ncbi:hypothetical protein M413DRAFT_440409, partial [Hebeloma cylindrosporum]